MSDQPVYQLRRTDTGILLGTWFSAGEAVRWLREHYSEPPPHSITPVKPWEPWQESGEYDAARR